MSDNTADLLQQVQPPASGLLDRPPPAEAPAQQSAGGPDAVDNAFDEFLQRCAVGEELDPDRFCDEHPSIKSSLQKLLHVHILCEAQADLFAPPEEDDWPHTGQVFLGLQLQRLLGRGAFARVFLATEEALGGRRVAVKVAFRGGDEARTQGRLEHRNVVPVYSITEDPSTHLTAVVMPYLGNATLHDVLDRILAKGGPPPQAREILDAVRAKGRGETAPAAPEGADTALRKGGYIEGVVHLAAQVADALEYIHEQGILHLDLKPSNVLLTPDGRPMLLDFNLARDRQYRRQRLGGTLPYMAPEQLRAIGAEREGPGVDARSDLFSLGVLLYELLAGRHPFGPISLKEPEAEVRALLLARQTTGAKPLHEVNPRVGEQLSQLVHRCLETDPARRPASAGDLATGLRRTQRSFWRWLTRHAAVVCGILVLLVMTGVLAAALTSSKRIDPSPEPRDPQLALETGIQALAKGDFRVAEDELAVAVEAYPDDPRAQFAFARALDKQGKLTRARDHYNRAYRKGFENKGLALACLAYAESRGRRPGASDSPEEAIFHYQKALEARYRTPVVYNNLGFMCLRVPIPKGQQTPVRLDLAEASFNQAIELDPNFSAAYLNRMRLEEEKVYRSSSYIPLQGVADAQRVLPKQGACAWDYARAAFLCATAAERGERLFSPGKAAVGSSALLAASAAAADRQQVHLGQAALGGWGLTATLTQKTTSPVRPGQQGFVDLLVRCQEYRERAKGYLRQANAGGLGAKEFLKFPVLRRLLPEGALKEIDRKLYPPDNYAHFDPLDGK
jgi:eukaryotic-like serine/threonine-protein kinase